MRSSLSLCFGWDFCRQQPADCQYLLERGLDSACQGGVHPVGPHRATSGRGFGEYLQRRSGVRAQEEARIEAASRDAGCRRLSVSQLFLAFRHFCCGNVVGGQRGDHLRLKFGRFLLGPCERLPRLGNAAQGPSQSNLERLRRRQLGTDASNLLVEPRGDVPAEGVARDLRPRAGKGLKLPFEGLDGLRADQRRRPRP